MTIECYRNKKWDLFKKKIYVFDSSNGPICIVNRENTYATWHLMRLALKQGCSVISYGKRMDYYQHLWDIAPTNIEMIDYGTIMKHFSMPFIKGSCDNAEKKLEDCFHDFWLENKYKYLKGKSGKQLADPGRYQCFYQIISGNTAKEKVITESCLTNILAQVLFNEPIHELIVFLDMPFRPITKTLLEVLDMAKQISGISVIGQYKFSRNEGQPIVVDYNGKKIALKASKKEFIIKSEETYQ